MLSKWFSGISFLFQAGVVIAGVAVFSYFDPFDLLTSEKLKLKNTPVSVKSMQEIGELITAEYYGEVIASTMEDVEIQETSMTQEFGDSLEVIHEYFLDALDDLNQAADSGKVNKKRRRQLRLHYEANNQKLLSLPWYDAYINYVSKNATLQRETFDKKDFDKGLGASELGNLLKDLVADTNKYDKVSGFTFEPLKVAFTDKIADVNEKKFRKRQLVLLGRGWVKVGFKFDKFTEDNFRFDRGNSRIIFIGMSPEILSATINPWFIPEKGVEGFEFLIVERKAQRDYEVMKRVKQLCLDKLEKQAMERDIFELATKNAQEQLKSFFELLMGEPIKQVSFYNNVLDYTLAEIKRGGDVISGEDLHLIERALNKSDSLLEHGYIKEKQVTEFMATVKSMPYQLFDSTKREDVSPFLTMAYTLGVDGELKYADSLSIKRYTPASLQKRSWIRYWYDASDSTTEKMNKDFNSAISSLKNNVYRIELDSADLWLKDVPEGSNANATFNNVLNQIITPR